MPPKSTEMSQLEAQLRQHVIFQDDVIAAVAGGLHPAGAQPSRGSGPRASYLFLGPVGVGKTELAKALAEALYGSRDAMTRLEAAKIDPPQLADAVRRQPRQVVLVDEVGNAPAPAAETLAQLLEGRSADLSQAVVILTTSAGTTGRGPDAKPDGGTGDAKARVRTAARRAIDPALLEGIGTTVVFNFLDHGQYREIADMMLGRSAVS